MSNVISVPYREGCEVGDLQEGMGDQGLWARKVYYCGWKDRLKFMVDMRGDASRSGPFTGGATIRGIPYQYPIAGTSIYAKDIAVDPVGKPIIPSSPLAYSDSIDTPGARITVTFGVPDWNFQGSDDPLFLNSFSQDPTENASLLYATQEMDFGSEGYKIPNSSVMFSGGDPVTEPTIGKISIVRMTITWHRFPLMPLYLIRNYADSVNDAVFLGAAMGTVYFEGARTTSDKSVDATGNVTRAQKVQMSFKWRKEEWNKFLKPDGFTWEYLVQKPGLAAHLLPVKDFSQLLL